MSYAAHSLERRVTEQDKKHSTVRSAFERDRARVLHSSALRRLAAKTQVVGPGEGDFPRTRLTHSLECAQIGREMAIALGADGDLVDAACLAHDLGHPPFGHNGEDALHDVAADFGGFEGNAQSLRVLTLLEPKVEGVGLNLTRATLDAVCKYPWLQRPDTRKYGVYGDQAELFDWIRDGAQPGVRSFEAQIMDWADDVAYSVHDLEDGLHGGHIDPTDLLAHRDELVTFTHQRYPGIAAEVLAEAFDGLVAQPWWPTGFGSTSGALAALKRTSSELTGRFCGAAIEATKQAYGSGALTRYDADLVVPERFRAECALLKATTARFVMTRAGVTQQQDKERAVVRELVEALVERGGAALSPFFVEFYERAPDDAGRMRAVIDQVASLTDPGAMAWHERLFSA